MYSRARRTFQRRVLLLQGGERSSMLQTVDTSAVDEELLSLSGPGDYSADENRDDEEDETDLLEDDDDDEWTDDEDDLDDEEDDEIEEWEDEDLDDEDEE